MVDAGSQYLYRGISETTTLEETILLALRPRRPGPFSYCFLANGTVRADGSATAGPSDTNAVLRHELRQEGFGSAGISTTPLFERARFYALTGGRNHRGVVITIDRGLLEQYGVKEFVVAMRVPHPSVPEDHEVILVASDGGALPRQIVAYAVQVVAEQPA